MTVNIFGLGSKNIYHKQEPPGLGFIVLDDEGNYDTIQFKRIMKQMLHEIKM